MTLTHEEKVIIEVIVAGEIARRVFSSTELGYVDPATEKLERLRRKLCKALRYSR